MTEKKVKGKEVLAAFEQVLDKLNPDMEDAQTAVLMLLSHIQAQLGRKPEPNKVHLTDEEFAKFAMGTMTSILGDRALAVFGIICWADGENTTGMMHNPKATDPQVAEIIFGRIPQSAVEWLAARGVPVGMAVIGELPPEVQEDEKKGEKRN